MKFELYSSTDIKLCFLEEAFLKPDRLYSDKQTVVMKDDRVYVGIYLNRAQRTGLDYSGVYIYKLGRNFSLIPLNLESSWELHFCSSKLLIPYLKLVNQNDFQFPI